MGSLAHPSVLCMYICRYCIGQLYAMIHAYGWKIHKYHSILSGYYYYIVHTTTLKNLLLYSLNYTIPFETWSITVEISIECIDCKLSSHR